ncbi:MAG: hypothetical protein WA840_22060 [Caulobacteraceae bacterium]
MALIRFIQRQDERHVDYLSFIGLPFFLYFCSIHGASHPGLDTAFLLSVAFGVGLIRAVRFPRLRDAIISPLLGYSIGATTGGIVTLLNPGLGHPQSWDHLGLAVGFTFCIAAWPLAVLRLSDDQELFPRLRRGLWRSFDRLGAVLRRIQTR